MSLYPTIVLDAATAALDNNFIPPGTLVVIPIDMTVPQMTQISMAQLSLTQDYSLRTWVSVYPGGRVIDALFPILRTVGLPFIIYVAGQTPPANATYTILVTPGNYYLNILNLTNEANVFAFSQTDLSASPSIDGGVSIGVIGTVIPLAPCAPIIGPAGSGIAGIVAGTPGAAALSPMISGGPSTGIAGTTLT